MKEQDRLLSIAWEQFRPDANGLVRNSEDRTVVFKGGARAESFKCNRNADFLLQRWYRATLRHARLW